MPIENRDTSETSDTADELLASSEAAALIGVHRDTLKRYEDRDHLIESLRTPSGHRRYRRSDVEALLNRRQKAAS